MKRATNHYLPQLVLLVLLSTASSDVEAAKLIDVSVLDKDYLIIHLSDGDVIHNEGIGETVTRHTPGARYQRCGRALNIIQMTTESTPLASKRSVVEAYTSGRDDGVAGVHPGHTPYFNLDDWSPGMVMGRPSALYENSYPSNVPSTWPVAEAFFPSRWVWAHTEFTPQQTMCGKMALYGYLYGLAGTPLPTNPTLTVGKSGSGSGTVTSSPSGIEQVAAADADLREYAKVTDEYLQKSVDAGRIGAAVEHLVAASCILASGGALNVSTSLIDDEGVDLVFHRRGRPGALAVQVKSRSRDAAVVRRGQFTASVRPQTFNPRPDMHRLFVVVDRPTATIDTVWLVPSKDFDRLAGTTGKGMRRITASLKPDAQDKWRRYRMHFRDLPGAILAALDKRSGSS